MVDCVLIVPTFQRSQEVITLLEALTRLPDFPAEVAIIDGSPTDSTETVIKRWAESKMLRFDLKYVKSPPGLTRQRNVGLDACDREFIFFLDDDCRPHPGYFSSIRDVFVADKCQEIGAVRGFLTNGIHKPITRLWRLRFALGIVPRGQPGRYHACGTSGTWDMVPTFRGVRPVDVLAGGASAYRREVFSKHRFSEFFYGYAQGEDFEMALRIGKEWKLLECGDALVDHNHAEGGRPDGFARGKMVFRNRYFIWQRHSPDARLQDRIRFWADHVLVFGYYLAGFVTRPWRLYFFGYAAGTLWGALLCLISPPHYEEPVARRQYGFCVEELPNPGRALLRA